MSNEQQTIESGADNENNTITDDPAVAAAKFEILGASSAGTDQPVTDRADGVTVEKTEPSTRKTVRPRNYSHMERDPETLDEVDGCDGKTYKVPATMGSMYWAILVCMYENVNKPVYPDTLVKRVDEVMREHDEESWESYCNKTNTTVWKRGKQSREVQAIRPVADRTINNAKTLTRWKDYGRRLYERGHVLRWEYDGKAQPYFVLRTNLDCLKKKEPKKEKDGTPNSTDGSGAATAGTAAV